MPGVLRPVRHGYQMRLLPAFPAFGTAAQVLACAAGCAFVVRCCGCGVSLVFVCMRFSRYTSLCWRHAGPHCGIVQHGWGIGLQTKMSSSGGDTHHSFKVVRCEACRDADVKNQRTYSSNL